jgi:hypothetical protein
VNTQNYLPEVVYDVAIPRVRCGPPRAVEMDFNADSDISIEAQTQDCDIEWFFSHCIILSKFANVTGLFSF